MDDLILDPKETALIFIEFQNEFTSPGGGLYDAVKDCMSATGTLANAKAMLAAGRSIGCTIVHCPISFLKGHMEISNKPYGILAPIKNGQLFQANEWASEICDDMKPLQGDLICIGKSGLCGFASTNLDFLLRQNNIRNVVLCGFLTNCCVESTMRTAYEKGYRVFTLKDCCAATSVEAQEAAYQHTFGMFSYPTTSAVS
jgi:nicotinamidase-related amidase